MANLSNINNILRVSSSGVGINKNNTGPSELDIESAGADIIDMTRTNLKTYRFAISGASAFSLFDVAAGVDRLTIDSSGNSTFAGNVNINKSSPYITLNDSSAANQQLAITQSGSTANFQTRGGASTKGQFIFKQTDGTTSSNALIINQQSNATFIGNVTTGGQVTVPAGYSVNIGTSRIHSAATSYLLGGNVGIGTDLPTANLNVVGPGDANDPVVAIDVTNSSAFNHGLEIFDANLTDGETVLMAIGKAGSTKNTAIFGYIHDADGGNDNLATIGFWGADNKMTVSAGGNVGIGTGTTSPTAKLDIAAGSIYGINISGTGQLQNAPTGNYDHLYTPRLRLGYMTGTNIGTIASNGGDSGISLITHSSSTGWKESLRVQPSGNVGIGTDSPTSKLHIVSDEVVLGSVISDYRDLGVQLATSQETGNSGTGISFDHGALGAAITSARATTTTWGTDLRFYTHPNATTNQRNVTERMRINSEGNVGIGTTTPDAQLSGTKGLSIVDSGNAAIGLSNGTEHWLNYLAGSGANSKYRFWNNSANEIMTLTYDGKVGIGTDSPYAQLHVSHSLGNGGIMLGNTATTGSKEMLLNIHPLGLIWQRWVNGAYQANLMTLDYDGNLGIGTITPGTKLEISDATGPTIRLRRADVSVVAGDLIGGIENYNQDADGAHISSFIRGYATETYGRQGYLTFGTSGVNSTDATEKMRITSGGFTKAKANGGNYFNGSYHEFVNNNNVSGDRCLVIGNKAGSATNNTSSISFIVADGAGDRLYIYGNGNVVNLNNSYGALSDVKLKENIVDATSKLDDLMKVKIRNYNLIGDDKKQIGVVAQELEEVFPNMIDESIDYEYKEITDEEGNITEENIDLGTTTKSVKYSVFVPMLIKAIQELKAEIEILKNK